MVIILYPNNNGSISAINHSEICDRIDYNYVHTDEPNELMPLDKTFCFNCSGKGTIKKSETCKNCNGSKRITISSNDCTIPATTTTSTTATMTTTTTTTTITTTTTTSTAENTTIIAQGVCGKSLNWRLDNAGTLIVSGNGEMDEWGFSGDSPWYYRSDIKNVVINSGVTRISGNAFLGCENIVSVSLPNSVESIGFGAFSGCVKLKSINIPSSVTKFEGYPFSECPWLDNKRKDNSMVIINGVLIDGIKCSGDITIPNNVTDIIAGAFCDCETISSIVIPESVESVSDAFLNCKNLNSITVLNSSCYLGGRQSIFVYNDDSNGSYTGVLRGYSNSTAAVYALNNNCRFEAIDEKTQLPDYDTPNVKCLFCDYEFFTTGIGNNGLLCPNCHKYFLPNTSRLDYSQTAEDKVFAQKYPGIWHTSSTDEHELIIHVINSSQVVFSVWYYRLWSEEFICAQINGNKASFTTSDNNVSGYLTFNDNSVVLTITKSNIEWIKTNMDENYTENGLCSAMFGRELTDIDEYYHPYITNKYLGTWSSNEGGLKLNINAITSSEVVFELRYGTLHCFNCYTTTLYRDKAEFCGYNEDNNYIQGEMIFYDSFIEISVKSTDAIGIGSNTTVSYYKNS